MPRPAVVARHLFAAAVFIAMAVVWTWPLLAHLSTSIPGTPGDNLAFLWNDWSMRESLTTGTSPFFSDRLFAPFGIDLTLHTHTALTSWLSATVLRSLSVVTAHNVLLLAALALNGFSAYLLVWDRLACHDAAHEDDRREASARWAGALVGGLIFGGSPYIAAHLYGHVNLVSAWGIPLFVIAFLRTIERRSFSAAIGAACVAVATAFNDYYYLVYIAAIAVVVLAQRLWRVQWVESRQRRWLSRTARILLAIDLALVAVVVASGGFEASVLGVRITANRPTNLLAVAWLLGFILVLNWRHPRVRREKVTLPWAPVAAVVAVTCIGLSPLIWRAVGVMRAGAYVAPDTSWRSGPSGIDLLTLFLGHPWHGWYGATVRQLYDAMKIDSVEQIGWMGVLPLLLAIGGWLGWQNEPKLRTWRWLGLVFFVWALGPWLKVGGFDTGLLLPQNVLAHLPIVGNARMPGRAIVVVFLAVSVFAAAAVARRRRYAPAWAAAVFAVVGMEFLPSPFPMTPLATPALYQALRDLPAGAVCELPFGIRDGFGSRGRLDEHVLAYQMTHQHPLVGGFVARMPPSVRDGYSRMPILRSLLLLSEGAPIDAADAAQPRDAVAAALANANVKYVVLDRAQASAALAAYVTSYLPVRSIAREGDRELFVVEPNDR